MHRLAYRYVAISLLALGASGCSQESSTSAPISQNASARPNVIVILADDLGYADISAYGIKRISTPNIDRIGDEGVKFTDAYAAAPVCAPSRAALQTGRYPGRYG
ncbi:MAG TPA: sulfatase-like hydrolase/transferase, partial [Steroidobacteraceae bacterium]